MEMTTDCPYEYGFKVVGVDDWIDAEYYDGDGLIISIAHGFGPMENELEGRSVGEATALIERLGEIPEKFQLLYLEALAEYWHFRQSMEENIEGIDELIIGFYSDHEEYAEELMDNLIDRNDRFLNVVIDCVDKRELWRNHLRHDVSYYENETGAVLILHQ